MKATLLKRLKRLEEVQATENPPPAEFQTGYLKRLSAEYTGDRYLVTVGRDADGTYHWEERPGREPDQGKSNLRPPFRVVLVSPEEYAPAAQTR